MPTKITIELEEDEIVGLIHGCAQSSCAFNRNHVEENLWHLHCCDYNEPIKRTIKQIDSASFEYNENRMYIERLQKETDLMEHLEKAYLEDLTND